MWKIWHGDRNKSKVGLPEWLRRLNVWLLITTQGHGIEPHDPKFMGLSPMEPAWDSLSLSPSAPLSLPPLSPARALTLIKKKISLCMLSVYSLPDTVFTCVIPPDNSQTMTILLSSPSHRWRNRLRLNSTFLKHVTDNTSSTPRLSDSKDKYVSSIIVPILQMRKAKSLKAGDVTCQKVTLWTPGFQVSMFTWLLVPIFTNMALVLPTPGDSLHQSFVAKFCLKIEGTKGVVVST